MSETEEISKAIQQSAKTTEKALEVSEKVGGFISKYIDGSLEQAFGIWEDKLKYLRWKNQLNLIDKVNELISERKLHEKTNPIPLKFAIPILENGSLEEDDYLQKLWAKLLINSTTSNTEFNLTKTYINILEQLSKFEAQILLVVYHDNNISHNEKILTHYLPDAIMYQRDNEKNLELTEDVKLALENLYRLGCIGLSSLAIGGPQNFGCIHRTMLGEKLTKSIK